MNPTRDPWLDPLPGGRMNGVVPAVEPTSGDGARRLGAELRRMRLERGLSQREVVRRLGLNAHSNLSDYEHGRRIPPGDILKGCEALFGLPTRYLERLRAAALAERVEPVACQAHVRLDRCPDGYVEKALPETRPRQLPANVADFTGRHEYLKQLDSLLADPGAETAGAVPIGAIVGAAGVGKSGLAIQWAHQVRDRFPSGQLYVDAQGNLPGPPLRPIAGLTRFLRALEVPAERIPSDTDEAAALFRSVLADRRMLVVVDNVVSPEQVRPLLPGSAGCLMLVTSRNRLDGLVARDGARRVTLGPLSVDEAMALLVRLLGAEGVAAEPRAAAELAEACALLPLALRIAAASLDRQDGRRIASFVRELTTGNRLDLLHVADDEHTAVRAALDLSYHSVPADAQRLFRRLGSLSGTDVTPEDAAALAGTTVAEAGRLLDRLARVHLLAQLEPGRYTLHTLLRIYAAELAQRR